MKSSGQLSEQLEAHYRLRYRTVLKPLETPLATHILGCVGDQPRIDRVTARAKDVDSFVKKAQKLDLDKGGPKYSEPLAQIQDQIGARIVTFYQCDVERLDAVVKKYFRAIEFKDHLPESEWEFGYFGRHYVLALPTDVIGTGMDPRETPPFFELQVKTLFEHAWSEAEHDIGYKPGRAPLTSEQTRRLAFTSAQAWGADRVFNELFSERNPTT